MKTRILSALVGLVILGVVFVFLDTLLLNIVIGLICVLGVHELLAATGCTAFKGLTVLAMLMTIVIPFARAGHMRRYLFEAVYILVICFFVLLIKNHKKMRFEHFAMAFFFSTVVPVFFSCAVFIRDDAPTVACGGFYLLLALGSAWLCDTGAYFVGSRFGKHKLAPQISPNKTVEGAVGGVVVCVIFMLLLAFGYNAAMDAAGTPVTIQYGAVALATPVFAIAGMLGDLSASVIKRAFGVKDFGTIMPGHGGIIDRFDSVLFTLPAVYILCTHINVVMPG